MRFEFATAARIVFGPGTVRDAGALAREFGARACVVTGKCPERANVLLGLLAAQGIATTHLNCTGEPDVALIERGVAQAKVESCDMVISFGGGSVIDAGKAIAAMITNEGELLDYLEVIGRGKSLARAGAPFIAVPTTAGTGSEVTRNAVLGSPVHRVKVSLRSPLMLAKIALVDPELTHGLPPALTAATGMDALTQLIEPYVSCRANPMVDALCVEGIQRAARSLRTAFSEPANAAAREDMCVASLFGGLALANAGLGAVHGFAGPIGGMFPAPHGATCGALLPHVMEANLRALQKRRPASEPLRRYDQVARLLTGNLQAMAAEGISWVSQLAADLRIQPLGTYGITRRDVPELVEKSAKASSMKANPIPLLAGELAEVLERAL
jgi:alcohol dehydrogenase class IV